MKGGDSVTATEIKKELYILTNKRPFITAAEVCMVVGDSNAGRVKKKYLEGLEKVGKGYFVPEVAQRLKNAAVMD